MIADIGRQAIRVMVVDDSALMSRQISDILDSDRDIEVVGRAKDGQEALVMLSELQPDVITLDVEMPRMNGITALKHIMVRHSTPTVMISALTREGSKTTFDALKYGAVDVIAKPSRRESESLEAQRADIIAKVKRAAAIRTGRFRYVRISTEDSAQVTDRPPLPDDKTPVIAIGAGTGGYYGLLRIVPALTEQFDGLLIAMMLVAPRYVDPFVTYLEHHSSVGVKGLRGIAAPRRGTCYICAGQQGCIVESTENSSIRLRETGPSSEEEQGTIDSFLKSVAHSVGNRAIGVLMTGAGRDGALGLAEIRKAGGTAIVQDINNCVDPGMPLAALEHGTVDRILPDYMMAEYFVQESRSR
jgi:two-component system, chemotaxis family, protein-glutamate methylesterase/glutaminase